MLNRNPGLLSPSHHYLSQQNVENEKNNPNGKQHNQETLLAVIKKQRNELEKYKKVIIRLEKDVDRYRNEAKLVKGQHELMKRKWEYGQIE